MTASRGPGAAFETKERAATRIEPLPTVPKLSSGINASRPDEPLIHFPSITHSRFSLLIIKECGFRSRAPRPTRQTPATTHPSKKNRGLQHQGHFQISTKAIIYPEISRPFPPFAHQGCAPPQGFATARPTHHAGWDRPGLSRVGLRGR